MSTNQRDPKVVPIPVEDGACDHLSGRGYRPAGRAR
jgi:hypothetical protein